MDKVTIEQQIYICKYAEEVGLSKVAESLGGNWTAEKVEKTINILKKNGIYEQYRNMPYDEWEKKITISPKKRGRPAKVKEIKVPVGVELEKENETLTIPQEEYFKLIRDVSYYQGRADVLEEILKAR